MVETGDYRATTTRQLFTISMSRFMRDSAPSSLTEDSDEMELSLGLSLNGRFGVDPMRTKSAALQLKRSSSVLDFSSPVASMMTEKTTMSTCGILRASYVGPLMRTCSLPTETEEEWRRRKELQSLRRMEVKRKRSEKQQRSSINNINHNINSHNTKLVRHRSRQNFDDAAAVNCRRHHHHHHPLPPLPPPPESQGTVGSQGSGSSVITEADNSANAAQVVVHKCTKARSGVDVELLPKNEKEPTATPTTVMASETTRQLNGGVQMQNQSTSPDKETKEMVKNVSEKMPCVSTTGHGPDGKRIEGFLYRYKKGEEVRIVCVCHGSFLTPAEFVKHAGGGDVPHPLKHIVVSPTPIS